MRALIQRVSRAQVTVDGRIAGKIGAGLLVLLGVGKTDTNEEADYLAAKVPRLRIFETPDGKMNASVSDIGGALLVVSQFTLFADMRKGRRPSFHDAAPPNVARRLYERFLVSVRQLGIEVQTGQFQAHMEVELVNDGPVTLLCESPAEWRARKFPLDSSPRAL